MKDDKTRKRSEEHIFALNQVFYESYLDFAVLCFESGLLVHLN